MAGGQQVRWHFKAGLFSCQLEDSTQDVVGRAHTGICSFFSFSQLAFVVLIAH